MSAFATIEPEVVLHGQRILHKTWLLMTAHMPDPGRSTQPQRVPREQVASRPATSIDRWAKAASTCRRVARSCFATTRPATANMGGACAGVGTIFGHYLAAALRNPSAAQGQFGNLIFGFAVTEALGIFSFVIALLLLFAL